jgi:hypothetical protein
VWDKSGGFQVMRCSEDFRYVTFYTNVHSYFPYHILQNVKKFPRIQIWDKGTQYVLQAYKNYIILLIYFNDEKTHVSTCRIKMYFTLPLFPAIWFKLPANLSPREQPDAVEAAWMGLQEVGGYNLSVDTDHSIRDALYIFLSLPT